MLIYDVSLDSPSCEFLCIYIDPCCYISDLPGVNPATNDRMIPYYCIMTKVDWFIGLCGSTVFSLAGCHSTAASRRGKLCTTSHAGTSSPKIVPHSVFQNEFFKQKCSKL
jgi:hypothetical protein